ncbi:MAG: hypothetical protein D6726_10720 [Nitrospirae bacterium]|nr:MAG: hypothetical protein D6726_10720 [Nitrospirota bacterium]
MRYIQALMLVAGLFLLGAFFGAQYLSDKNNTPSPVYSEKTIRVSESSSLADIMSYLNIYQVKEPWPAPEFRLPSLGGDLIDFGSMRGKYVLLAFWTTW